MQNKSNIKQSSLTAIVGAIFLASFVAATLSATISFARALPFFSFSTALSLFFADLLIGMGSLTLLSAGICFLLTKFFGSDKTVQAMAKPIESIVTAWRAAGDDVLQTAKIMSWTLTQLIFFFFQLVGSMLVLYTFKEPIRMCLIIAVMAVLLAPLAGSTGKVLGSKLAPLLNRSKQSGRMWIRSLVMTAGLTIAAAITLTIVYFDEVFGATDPSLFFVLTTYVASISIAVWLRLPFFFVFEHPIRVLAVGTVFVILGMLVPVAHDDCLATMIQRGVISKNAYRAMFVALDFDGDGSPWLIGEDCHPFDSKLGPFSAEILHNGIDENCDGSDNVETIVNYVDPLDTLPSASYNLRRKKGNVLFVILDAVRADHLFSYGYSRKTTPALDRFAKTATIFDNFFAVTNHTSTAMPAILTGHFPSVFPNIKKVNWSSFKLDKSFRPIQTRFASKGYATSMYQGHGLVGFIKGFQTVNKDGQRRTPAGPLTDLAVSALKAIGSAPRKPVLFFIHYIDTHHPYKALEKPKRFGTSQKDKYDAELAYIDENLAKVLSIFESDEYKDWLVIITSDHGEAFYEHGIKYHGFNLYNEEVHVPLIMKIPGTKPGRESIAASHLDLLPTIIDWAGMEKDPDLPGRSLLPLFTANRPALNKKRAVFAEGFRSGDQFAVFDGEFSLIFRELESRYEAYNRRIDRFQNNNLQENETPLLLRKLLDKHIREANQRLGRN